jgi:hypothetical protein
LVAVCCWWLWLTAARLSASNLMASAASIVVSNTSTKTAADDAEVLILALRGGENVKTERDFRGHKCCRFTPQLSWNTERLRTGKVV